MLIRKPGVAIRDREYMRDWAYRDWDHDLFHLRSERGMERDLLNSLKAKGLRPQPLVSTEEDRLLPSLPAGPWDIHSARKTQRMQYILSAIGGLILVAPMVLMVLLKNVTANLVTVCACTVVFAVATAYFSPTKLPIELLGATAAYAAVLVVFVSGTTG
jgi:VIT1/CCC1 family predicted Fe2+/Mn2+ transporter